MDGYEAGDGDDDDDDGGRCEGFLQELLWELILAPHGLYIF